MLLNYKPTDKLENLTENFSFRQNFNKAANFSEIQRDLWSQINREITVTIHFFPCFGKLHSHFFFNSLKNTGFKHSRN